MQVHSEEGRQATANKQGTIWRIHCNRPTVYSIDILDTRVASFQWRIIKDHQKTAMVQAQRVWNVWSWKALFQFFRIYFLSDPPRTLHAWTDTRGIRLISAPHWLLNALQRLERELPNQWRLAVVIVGSSPEIPTQEVGMDRNQSRWLQKTAVEWC